MNQVSPPVETYPTSTHLLEAARQVMDEQGVSAQQIDPAVVVIAAVKPKQVYDIGWADFNRYLAADHTAFLAKLDENHSLRRGLAKPDNDDKPTDPMLTILSNASDDRRHIENTGNRLNNPSSWGILAKAAAVGWLAANGFMLWMGSAGGWLDKPGGDKLVPQDAEHQILKGNMAVWDSSVLPGHKGDDIPVIGPVLRNIPGMIDIGEVRYTYTSTVPEVVTEENVTQEQKVNLGNSLNPLSPDLQPTGGEYAPDRVAAKELLGHLNDAGHFTPESITIVGEVSDDLNGKVGEADQAQLQLADARARIAEQALRDEAAAQGVTIPSDALIIPHEAVLDDANGLLPQIKLLAEANKMSVAQLISKYNSGQELAQELQEFMDKNIGAKRGATISITGKLTTTKLVEVTKYKDGEAEGIFGDINGEEVGGLVGLTVFMYGGVFNSLRRRGRHMQKVARKKAKKAGLDLSDVNLLERAASIEV